MIGRMRRRVIDIGWKIILEERVGLSALDACPQRALYRISAPRDAAHLAQDTTQKATLIRGLSLTDSILLLAGGIIGSGIFLTAKDIAVNTRSPLLFLGIWVVGMVITLFACFAFAEMGAMFPQAGGQYVYVREAYGEFAAFLYGWMIFTVSVTGTVAALGAGFAEYIGKIFPAVSAAHVIFVFRFPGLS